jgi:hypothetical protein
MWPRSPELVTANAANREDGHRRKHGDVAIPLCESAHTPLATIAGLWEP